MNDNDSAQTDGVADEESSALIEVEPGVAVLVSDSVPEGLDILPIEFLDREQQKSFVQGVAGQAGWLNLAAQIAAGRVDTKGLVRLDPETLKAMEKGATYMKSGGKNLGVLMKNGKTAHIVRFTDAGGAAKAATVVPGVGQAAALVAVQARLDKIEGAVQQNIALTQSIYDELKHQQWITAHANYRTIAHTLATARHVGAVTDRDWSAIVGVRRDLEQQLGTSHEALKRHKEALGKTKTQQERFELLTDKGDALVQDAQALMLATYSLRMLDLMGAANASLHAADDPIEAGRCEKLLADSRATVDPTTETAELMEALRTEMNVAAAVRSRRFGFVGDRTKAHPAALKSARVAEQLNRFSEIMGLDPVQAHDVPQLTAAPEDAPAAILQVLPWRVVNNGERLLAVAEVTDLGERGIGEIGRKRWLAMTDDFLYVLDRKEVESYGAVDRHLRLDDIRFVRVRDADPRRAPRVDIVTKDSDYSFEFGGWARDSEGREKALAFARLLQSRMNLPQSEVPVVNSEDLLALPARAQHSTPAPPAAE